MKLGLLARKGDTTDVADAAVEVQVGEARPPGISQFSAATESEVEGSSGEAGSSWPGSDDKTRHVDATVAEAVGEAWPPGIAEHSVATALVPREPVQQRTVEKVEDAPQFPEETVEAVTLVPRERLQQRTAARPADKARPPGTAKKSATTDSDIAVSLGEAGRPRANGRNVVDTAVARIADEDRPPGIAKQCATKKPEHAERVPVELGLLGPQQVA